MKRLMLLCVVSLFLVALTTFVLAQGRLTQPQILRGNDIGFRVDALDLAGKAQGAWMVRYNGNWIEISGAGGIQPLVH